MKYLNFETDNGKKNLNLSYQDLAYEEKLEKHMINLYLQVLDDEYDKEDSKTMRRVGRVMDKIDYKRRSSKNCLTNYIL